jgi:hypothetical protein
LNPTPEQEQSFRQAAGNACFTWSWAVAPMREASAQQMTIPLIGDLEAEFNRIKRKQFPFMMETTTCANAAKMGSALGSHVSSPASAAMGHSLWQTTNFLLMDTGSKYRSVVFSPPFYLNGIEQLWTFVKKQSLYSISYANG